MSDESSTESKSAASSTSELQFVSFTGPSDWNESTVRHAIRSHVTRYQHRHRARKSPDGSKSKGSKVAPKAERKSSLAIPESKEESTSSRNSPKTPAELTPYSRLLGATVSNPSEVVHNALAAPEEASAVFLISNPVFGGALGVKGLHIDTKLILRRHLLDLDQQVSGSSSGQPPSDSSQGLVLTLTPDDAAPFSAALLLTASHMSQLQGMNVKSTELLRLREAAMEDLHSTVRRSANGVSDSLIVAVAIMAVYERLYGQEERFSVHIQGLRHMIGLRGGIGQPGIDAIFHKLVLLSEIEFDFSSLVVGTPVSEPGYFDEVDFK